MCRVLYINRFQVGLVALSSDVFCRLMARFLGKPAFIRNCSIELSRACYTRATLNMAALVLWSRKNSVAVSSPSRLEALVTG